MKRKQKNIRPHRVFVVATKGGSLASLPMNYIRDGLIQDDRVQVTNRMAGASVDFILIDQPYLEQIKLATL